jgi:hypothetical protein
MLFDYTIIEYNMSSSLDPSTPGVGDTTTTLVPHTYDGGAAGGASVPDPMPGLPGGGGRNSEE